MMPESEISSHATLTSVTSGVFYARLLHCSSLYIHRLETLRVKSDSKSH